MRSNSMLILLAIPSLLGSVLLMRLAGAVQSLQVQQIVVALIGIAAVLWMDRAKRQHKTETSALTVQQIRNAVVMLVPMLVGLLACFVFSETGNPSRWLKLGPLRLYFSAAVLPLALFLFARLHWRTPFSAMANMALMLAFAVLLALQPDFSQLAAFSFAGVFIVWHRPGSVVQKIVFTAALVLLCSWCQQQADTLQPVAYVEGVIQLAMRAGIVAMFAAVLSIALVPTGLFYIGIKRGSPEIIPIALYYIVIMICAYIGLTPMPLLGFGAGPVLGYFVLLAGRRDLKMT
ncbi:hypothetical protein [Undibacterium fentianense]|uniref:Uncharacterized protein n=1 Tax=Undibacterium fentianense TaxID=2828728 RepID=A0A941DYN4_9BURK|nr:hypothetical protein [Undibacterium fentianense]MBR7799195.1 hypothetical protein [Undibacterium fentianense]